VARRLAEKLVREQLPVAEALGGIDPDVTEAAALAHDIGHPPFGHLAEQELNDLLSNGAFIEGLEGNAQSFRVVAKLAIKDQRYSGLDLTRATLNAMLKYPWLRGTAGKRTDKWGAHPSETDDFDFARGMPSAGEEQKSAEAELMDWADDVTYAEPDKIHSLQICRVRIITAPLKNQ
jgi:dGTPase